MHLPARASASPRPRPRASPRRHNGVTPAARSTAGAATCTRVRHRRPSPESGAVAPLAMAQAPPLPAAAVPPNSARPRPGQPAGPNTRLARASDAGKPGDADACASVRSGGARPPFPAWIALARGPPRRPTRRSNPSPTAGHRLPIGDRGGRTIPVTQRRPRGEIRGRPPPRSKRNAAKSAEQPAEASEAMPGAPKRRRRRESDGPRASGRPGAPASRMPVTTAANRGSWRGLAPGSPSE